MNHHDRAYKQLFQHKVLLQLLFTPEMLGAEWVGLLDFSQAELLPNEHLSRKLDLRQNAPARLEAYQPQQRYLLIDQGLWAKNKALPLDNLAGLLFKLEHSENFVKVRELLQQVDKQSAQYRELRRAILSWLRYVIFPRVAPDFPADSTYSFSEVHDMIELNPRRWGYKERLQSASNEQREAWALQLLQANSLQELFH